MIPRVRLQRLWRHRGSPASITAPGGPQLQQGEEEIETSPEEIDLMEFSITEDD